MNVRHAGLFTVALLLASALPAQVRQVADLNTREIRALDRERTVVILQGAMLEEHGPYLPAGTDGVLRYKHGLFDAVAALELLYRVTDRFRLHTETGTAQAIDLLYEVDRNKVRALRDLASGRSRSSRSDAPPAGSSQ